MAIVANRWQAERMQEVPFSDIRRVLERAGELEKEGHRVIRLEAGRPDFDTPAHIKEAAIKALNEGSVHYSSNYGTLGLRQAIAAKLRRDNGLSVDPQKEVIVTVGCAEAIGVAMLAFLQPGDQVLVPDPAWLNYVHVGRMAGAEVVTYRLLPERDFQPDPEELAGLTTERTKMIVVNSPHNPTGGVLSLAGITAIARLAVRHDILVLSDEIYEKLVYDDAVHCSLAAQPGMAERTITINGFSKAYAMDGWRLGYVVAAPPLVNSMVRARQYLTGSSTTFTQAGAEAAYNGPQECVEEMRREFDRRRQFLVGALNEIEGIECVRPRGAFYVFPSVAKLGVNSAEMASLMLEKAHVAVVDGASFGSQGQGHIRLSYATDYESLEIAVERLRALVRSMI